MHLNLIKNVEICKHALNVGKLGKTQCAKGLILLNMLPTV